MNTMHRDTIINSIRSRMKRLDDYTNSKELNELQHMLSAIEAGKEAEARASLFLALVPFGLFDGHRRQYLQCIETGRNYPHKMRETGMVGECIYCHATSRCGQYIDGQECPDHPDRPA